jgi:hypothetical protein
MKKSNLIAFDVQFGDECYHLFAPCVDGYVSATSLQKALAVKVRGLLNPDDKGFFVVSNEDGFEKELTGDDNVGEYEKVLFELGLSKKQRKELQAVKLSKDDATNQLIKDKLQRRRFQSVLRIKRESAGGSSSPVKNVSIPQMKK